MSELENKNVNSTKKILNKRKIGKKYYYLFSI